MSFLKRNPADTKTIPQQAAVCDEEKTESHILEKYGKTKNSLDSTAIVNGKVCFDTSIRIEGKLNGEMHAKKVVVVGRSGVVQAQIRAESLVVLGIVKGDIEVTKGIEILAGGCVEGSVITPSISIETGALFNGNCTMKKEEVAETKIFIAEESPHAMNGEAHEDTMINGEYHEEEVFQH